MKWSGSLSASPIYSKIIYCHGHALSRHLKPMVWSLFDFVYLVIEFIG